jgi:hypothetical protein
MAIIEKTASNVGKDVGENGSLIHHFWECKLLQPLWKPVWRLLKKLQTELPYDPAIPLLSIYPREHKSAHNIDTCTTMFMTAPFTIDKLWNQSTCPSTAELISKLW